MSFIGADLGQSTQGTSSHRKDFLKNRHHEMSIHEWLMMVEWNPARVTSVMNQGWKIECDLAKRQFCHTRRAIADYSLHTNTLKLHRYLGILAVSEAVARHHRENRDASISDD
jgi:hypothetical protein